MGSLIAQGIVGVLLPAVLALILNGLVLRISGLGEVRKWAQGKTIRPLMLRGIAVLAVIALAFFALFLITPVGAE
jgi:hypothetical protein